jgi:ABC-2 type transport system ATP-binding protein
MSTLAFHDLTKRYGDVTAIEGLTAQVRSGRVTAFLGANGSGKTTSMRLLLGLSVPTAGTATIGGRAYRDLPHPMREVGAVLDQGFHPNRSALNHLRLVAMQAQVPPARAEEVLGCVGLAEAGKRRVAGFSLGMRQRLALASALIGAPASLVLDEPFNGLDPDGIQAMKTFLRRFADDGGTVLLSSHLLAEVASIADDAVILDRGHLVTAGPVAGLVTAQPSIVVTTPEADLLGIALQRGGATVERPAPDQIVVSGVSREVVGRAAADLSIPILDMRSGGDGLEAAFQTLIHHKES